MTEESRQDNQRNPAQDRYASVTKHILFYADARFKQLTLFVAITAALVVILFSKSMRVDHCTKIVLMLVGEGITILFWRLEKSSVHWWKRFVGVAAELDKYMKPKCYYIDPPPIAAGASVALQFFFVGAALFWFYLLIHECCCGDLTVTF